MAKAAMNQHFETLEKAWGFFDLFTNWGCTTIAASLHVYEVTVTVNPEPIKRCV